MNKLLIAFLEKSIQSEYISVYHDYDTQETVYFIPYNATLATRDVKLKLVQLMGLDWDDGFDEKNPADIDKAADYLIGSDETPLFTLTSSHFIEKNGILMTDFILDFEEDVIYKKSYQTDKLSKKNMFVKLMKKCSDKIIDQEKAAQEHKMEKMFISTNMFTLSAQHGRM